jgi:ABC-type phosphate transport system substrate-binding protein
MSVFTLWISGCFPTPASIGSITVLNATPAAFSYALKLAQVFRQSIPDQPNLTINPISLAEGWRALENGSAQGLIQLDATPDSYQTNSLGWAGIALVSSANGGFQGDLTRNQVTAIFLGMDDLAAASRPDGTSTRLFVYDLETDIQRQFNRLALAGMQPSSRATVVSNNWTLAQALDADVHGIGFMPCFNVTGRQQVIRVDGAMPDYSSVMAQAYPYRVPILVSTKSDVPPVLQAFIGWAQSKDGQEVLARSCPAGGKQ